MFVNDGNKTYRVIFRYSKHQTVTDCRIEATNGDHLKWELVGQSRVTRWSQDKNNKRVARKNAFTQALQNAEFDKVSRTIFWNVFRTRCKVK
jgi:hypothetical protein